MSAERGAPDVAMPNTQALLDRIARARDAYRPTLQAVESGRVLSVGTGVASVAGLPGVGCDELLRFERGAQGIAFNIDEDQIGVVLLDPSWRLSAGEAVERTGRVMDVAVGEPLIGRVIDPLGRPLDGRGAVATQTRWPIERPAPPIMDRAPVNVPLQTGLKVVDALIPIGLGAAIYLSEYASVRTRKIFKPTLELLAGVPSVVYGLFAVVFVGPVVLNDWLGIEVQTFSVLSAGLVLGVMIIPTVASLAEDAMSAVPRALREASYGLGANRMRTVLRVVFPAATSGIAAAIVLGLSRAVGETMIVAMAAGSQAKMVTNPLEGGQTMTGFIASAALGDSVQGSLDYYTLFAVGLLLFIVTLIINIISIRLVNRYREIY